MHYFNTEMENVFLYKGGRLMLKALFRSSSMLGRM